MSTEAIPIGEVFIELRDLVSQHSDFLFQYLLGLLGSVTSLLSPAKLVHMDSHRLIELTDPAIAFRKRLFELLQGPPMSGFPITQFDLELMHTILHLGEFLQVSTEAIPIGKVFVELGDPVLQNPDFLL